MSSRTTSCKRTLIWSIVQWQLYIQTRMHSSRMRTVGFSGPLGEGGCCQGCGMGVCTLPLSTLLPIHTSLSTPPCPHHLVHIPMSTPLQKCILGYTPSCPRACWDTHILPKCILGYIPSSSNRMTDTCKNITFDYWSRYFCKTCFSGG